MLCLKQQQRFVDFRGIIMAGNWRKQQEERERLQKIKEEEERRKKEEKVSQFAPTLIMHIRDDDFFGAVLPC